MDRAMAQSKRMIAVLSPAFLASVYTQPEWAGAFRRDATGWAARLVPVRVREVKPPEGLLGSIVWIDIVGIERAAAAARLLDGVRMYEGASPCAQSQPSSRSSRARGTGRHARSPSSPRFRASAQQCGTSRLRRAPS
jgi:hypothetical protein